MGVTVLELLKAVVVIGLMIAITVFWVKANGIFIDR